MTQTSCPDTDTVYTHGHLLLTPQIKSGQVHTHTHIMTMSHVVCVSITANRVIRLMMSQVSSDNTLPNAQQ